MGWMSCTPLSGSKRIAKKANFSATVKGGYAYAVYTADHHYAKIWVISVNEATFDFTCRVAYQSDTDNPELKPGRATIER